jgi:hypothetical protein
MFTKTTLKSLIAVAAVGATLTGMSATAQSHHTYDRRADRQVETRIDNIQDRIENGRRANRISYREARNLNMRLEGVINLARDYMRTGRGIDSREMAQLDARLDRISADVRYERHDRDNRRG